MTATAPDTRAPRCVAVLSDVHGNLVALRAVLADVDALGIDRIVVAGDMVGFGPDPDAVVDLLLERDALMIRGNWETDYVAPYEASRVPADWLADPRMRPVWWSMERLGRERRAALVGLPDRLMLDGTTLVVHGSPRHVGDAILADTSDAVLAAMFAGEPARLTFVGHTHRPLVRTMAERRIVNVGSVGLPLDGDPRAAYAVATYAAEAPDGWEVAVRRVTFDVEAAIAAYDNGLRGSAPWFVEIMAHQVRTAENRFGPWLRLSEGLPAEELLASVRRYLAGDAPG